MITHGKIKKRFRKLQTKKREEAKEDIPFEKIVSDNVEQLHIQDKEEENKIKYKWLHVLKDIFHTYGKCSIGNKVDIFNDGYDAYNDIIKEIDKSSKRVWFEVYIFDDSQLANKVVNSLCNAGKRGCDVILLIDFIGSFKIKNAWVRKLRENNVHVIFFNSLRNSIFNSFPFFLRDHRKIIITDEAAYCGSMNVAENVLADEEEEQGNGETKKLAREKEIRKIKDVEKKGQKEEDLKDKNIFMKKRERNQTDENGNTKNDRNNNTSCYQHNEESTLNAVEGSEESKQKCLMYYDMHIKIKGPAVKHLADVFLDSLNIAQKEIRRERIEEQKSYAHEKDSCYIQILESNVLEKKKSIQLTFETVIKNATNNIYITTSYFFPPGFLRRALLYALSKGVNISFLFSGNSDVLGDVPATYYIIKKFLKKYNRNVFEYTSFFKNRNSFQFNLYKYFNYKKYRDRWNSQVCKNKNTSDTIFDTDTTTTGTINGYEKEVAKRKKRGINHFYFLQNKHCHAKNIVVDNLWSSIGSFNWDRYSSRRNLEVMVSIFDKKISDQFIKEHQEKVKHNSMHITLSHIMNRNIFQVFMSYCFYHLAKLSGKNIFDGLSNSSKKTVLRKALVNKYLKENCVQNISLNMMWAL